MSSSRRRRKRRNCKGCVCVCEVYSDPLPALLHLLFLLKKKGWVIKLTVLLLEDLGASRSWTEHSNIGKIKNHNICDWIPWILDTGNRQCNDILGSLSNNQGCDVDLIMINVDMIKIQNHFGVISLSQSSIMRSENDLT